MTEFKFRTHKLSQSAKGWAWGSRSLFISILVLCTTLSWAAQPLVIADFSKGTDQRGIPLGWQLKERVGKADFSIIKEGDLYALRLRSEETSFSFEKSVTIDPRQYPIFSWKWKVTKLPAGGDFRSTKKDDQAAQVFLAFSNRKIILYIWDTSAPKGSADDAWAPPFLTIKAIVLRSGHGDVGKWITETRNVYKDYMRLFGQEPPALAGIRIQINSQNTQSSGESFFGDMAFVKN